MASDRCPNCGRSSADCWLTAFPPQHFGTPDSGAMVRYQAHCLDATVARAEKAEAERADLQARIVELDAQANYCPDCLCQRCARRRNKEAK